MDKKLLKVASILGIIPLYNQRGFSAQKWYKYLFVLLIAIVQIYYVVIGFPLWGSFIIYVLMLKSIIFTANSLAFRMSITRFDEMQSFFQTISTVNGVISSHGIKPSEIRHALKITVAILLFYIVFFINILLNFWFSTWRYQAPEVFVDFAEELLINFGSIIQLTTIRLLTLKFEDLNRLMERVEMQNIISDDDKIIWKAKSILTVHQKLTECINLFNSLFGWQILLRVLIHLVNIFGNLKAFYNYNGTIASHDFMIYFGHGIISSIHMVVLVNFGNRLVNQQNRGVLNVHKLIGSYFYHQKVKECFQLVSQQMQAINVGIRPADFFVIDHTLGFTLINIFATYAIVIHQFYNK